MHYCVIDSNGMVVNIIIWDGDKTNNPYNPGAGLDIAGPLADGEQAAIGWTYHEDTDTFTPPDPME